VLKTGDISYIIKQMPYHIKKVGKKFKIIRDEDNVVVGTSDSKAKAQRSIGYRMEAIAKTERKPVKKSIVKRLSSKKNKSIKVL
jgi:hypothetical protein